MFLLMLPQTWQLVINFATLIAYIYLRHINRWLWLCVMCDNVTELDKNCVRRIVGEMLIECWVKMGEGLSEEVKYVGEDWVKGRENDDRILRHVCQTETYAKSNKTS